MVNLDPNVCCVLVPVGDHIEPACEAGLSELERRGYNVRRRFGCSAIDMIRSVMVTEALMSGFSEVLFIDADIVFNPSDVEKIRKHDLGFVCATYCQKGSGLLTTNFKNMGEVGYGKVGGLHKIDSCGFGFNLVRRYVIEAVEDKHGLPACNIEWGIPFIPYFLPMIHKANGKHRYLCEDLAFCQRCHDCGIDLWCDTTIMLYHVGRKGYSFKDLGKNDQQFFNQPYKDEPCEEELQSTLPVADLKV